MNTLQREIKLLNKIIKLQGELIIDIQTRTIPLYKEKIKRLEDQNE